METKSLIGDILPIVSLSKDGKLKEFCGTGFLIRDKKLITCWHCVSDGTTRYAAAFKNPTFGTYTLLPLSNIAQLLGIDVAVADINLDQSNAIEFTSDGEIGYGSKVYTFGYPLTDTEYEGDQTKITLKSTYMEGYIMRDGYLDVAGFKNVPTWQLSFSSHPGLSGAPLFLEHSLQVVGIIIGESWKYSYQQTVTKDASGLIDVDTVKFEHAFQYAAAHHVSTILKIKKKLEEGEQPSPKPPDLGTTPERQDSELGNTQ